MMTLMLAGYVIAFYCACSGSGGNCDGTPEIIYKPGECPLGMLAKKGEVSVCFGARTTGNCIVIDALGVGRDKCEAARVIAVEATRAAWAPRGAPRPPYSEPSNFIVRTLECGCECAGTPADMYSCMAAREKGKAEAAKRHHEAVTLAIDALDFVDKACAEPKETKR